MISPDFLLTTLIVVLLPGTGVIYTLAIGLGRGGRAALFAAFGCTLGIVPHMTASILGLAAVLHASAVAYEIVRYLGVAWLLYTAWGMWRGTGAVQVTPRSNPVRSWKIMRDAVLINLLNPKLSIFFLAFLPQFVAPDTAQSSASLQMVLLGVIFMVVTFAVFAIYGLFAAAVRTRIVERPTIMRWLGRGFATTFVALGVRLGLSAR